MNRYGLGAFALLTGGRLAGAAAAFAASLLIARLYGPETLGAFSVLLALGGVLSVIASGGFPAIAGVFAARYAAQNRFAGLKGFILTGQRHLLWGGLGSMGVLLIILMADSKASGSWLTMGLTALLAAAVVPGLAATNFFGAALAGLNRQQEGLLPDILIKPLVFLSLVAAAAASGLQPGPMGLLAFFASGALVAALLTGTRLLRLPFMAGPEKARKGQRLWRMAAAPWIVTTLIWDFFIELHILLAGWIAAPAEIAVLHVAFRFRMLAGYGMRALYALHLPDIISAHANTRTAQANARLRRVNLLALIYSAVVIGVFILGGSLLMGLFGPAFVAGWPLLPVLAATMAVRALFGPAPALLAMKGFHRPAAIIMLGCLIFSLITTMLLYPVMGLMGIATAYSTANLIGSAGLWFYCRRVTGIDSSLLGNITAIESPARSRA